LSKANCSIRLNSYGMNDKRCRACDVLIEENAARCSCEFVFWDDTPDHVITFGRLLFSIALLVGAVVAGIMLSHPTWAGQAKMTLGVLGGVALTFNIMPNVRKHGGVALSIAIVVLSCTAFSIGSAWRETHPPKPETVAASNIYQPALEVSMSGLQVGQKAPKSMPPHIDVEVDETGFITSLSGGSLDQEGLELLQPGDLKERLAKNFPRRLVSGPVYRLERDVFLFVKLRDDKVLSISIGKGHSSLGSGPEVDGLRVGIGEELVKVMSKGDRQALPRIAYSQDKPRAIEGLIGDSAITARGDTFQRGQSVNNLPDKRNKFRHPIALILDDKQRVEKIAVGQFRTAVFAPPLLSPKLAERLKADLEYHKCAKTDIKNRPLLIEERWKTPRGTIIARGPSPTTENRSLLTSEQNHSIERVSGRLPDWSLGEKSHWFKRTCEFRYGGEYYSLEHSKVVNQPSSVDYAFMREFGRAVIESRGRK
jgi:hypothetical protein